jgi:hypothetical protein
MSRDDEDYLDDPEIIDFNENLDARAAQQMEEGEISPLMFGRTGRGSPEMDLKEPRVLYRDAAKALRREGMDDSHLKDPINLVLNEQQKKEADEKQFDKMLDNMYKQTKKPVKSAARPKNMMPDSKLPPKKGGSRKRSIRSRGSRKSRRSRRSKRGSRKSKRSSRRRR